MPGGGPCAEDSTLIKGFYETWPIYGFAKTGQTIVNVTDSKTIKLFVDDESFWLPPVFRDRECSTVGNDIGY